VMTIKPTKKSSFHTTLHPYTLTPLHPQSSVLGTKRKKPTPVSWGLGGRGE
jgi:hypothetical protein